MCLTVLESQYLCPFSLPGSEGELEEEWLKEAGLSNLFAESTGDSQESMVFLSTLTRTQKAAVEKRVETVTQTLRKKNKHHQIPDVRDIFRPQSDPKGKVSSWLSFSLGTDRSGGRGESGRNAKELFLENSCLTFH